LESLDSLRDVGFINNQRNWKITNRGCGINIRRQLRRVLKSYGLGCFITRCRGIVTGFQTDGPSGVTVFDFAEARADSTLTAERCFRWPRKATTVAGSDCKFGYSLSALLALEVKLDWRFLPPRSPDALKHIGAHSSRFLHATKLVESSITAASNDASFSAALARDDRHHSMSQIPKWALCIMSVVSRLSATE
jgi:hypothetical protein